MNTDKLPITTHAGRFQMILESDTDVIVEFIENTTLIGETLEALLALSEDNSGNRLECHVCNPKS